MDDWSVSNNYRDFLKGQEGQNIVDGMHETYVDIAGKNTIGWGHTGVDVTTGLRITNEQAESLLTQDLAEAEAAIQSSVGVDLLPNQYDALVDFAYNVGVPEFLASKLLEKLNQGLYEEVPDELARWNKYTNPKTKKKEVSDGLVNRRNSEIDMWNDTEAGYRELVDRAVDAKDYVKAAQAAMKIDQTPGELNLTDVYQDAILRAVAAGNVPKPNPSAGYVDPIMRATKNIPKSNQPPASAPGNSGPHPQSPSTPYHDPIMDAAKKNGSGGGNGGNNPPDHKAHEPAHTPGGNPHPGDQHPGSQGSKPHDSKGRTTSDPNYHGPQPILLDLDGNGVTVSDLARSTTFKDGDDGLQHRTAWAGAGDGVLFFDPDGRNAITEKRQYVFTEWDPTGKSDMEALRSYFDTNGDGKLTSADAAFASFKVLVNDAAGLTTVMTLTQLGITSINLTEDSTRIELPDGSVIEGQATFKKSDGTTGTVASTMLMAEADGHRVTEVVTTDEYSDRKLPCAVRRAKLAGLWYTTRRQINFDAHRLEAQEFFRGRPVIRKEESWSKEMSMKQWTYGRKASDSWGWHLH